MNTVFIGGSRHISLLPEQVKHWLNDVTEKSYSILVGDANGVDKAVQKHLANEHYDDVTVYCSGESCRNNVGQWTTRHINASGNKKKFQFYAAKDREMVREAEFGFMVWDGKSPGTVLNVLRLVRASKKALLLNMQKKQTLTFNSETDWDTFLLQCTDTLRRSLESRALPTEWSSLLHTQTDLDLPEPDFKNKRSDININVKRDMDVALKNSNSKAFVSLLGQMAREKGMSQIAQETGLAREALYRALSSEGNPELATVLKVTNALKLRLLVGEN